MKASDLHKFSFEQLVNELKTYEVAITANPTDYGLVAGDATAMNTARTALEAENINVVNKRAAADAALEARDQAAANLIALARTQFKTVRGKAGITDETLAVANLDPYDTTRTPSPSPQSAPIAIVDYAKLRHIIRFRDSATPDSAAKPPGMMGCEIWVKLDGTPPVDETECTYLATDTASPYTANYSGADAKKTAYYLLRWVSKNGEKGPFSDVITATING